MSIGLKIKSNIAFSLALIALACMGWFSLREGRQLTEEARWVSHTYEVLETSASLRSHLADSEAARSAFILGDTKQLRVFERARDLALTDFADMRQLTADNREQQNRLRNLEPLLYSKLHTLQKSIDVHRTIKDDDAVQRAVADQGTRLTAQFASLLQVFDGVERGLLRERSAVAEKGSHRTTRATAALSGSSFLFLILALAALNRELSSRAQAERAVTEQRTLLQSILSSCKDAVVVADRSARVIFRNPAALRLHGGIPIDELMDGTTQMLGYHKSDGITLLPAEDLPIFRTLQGESVDGVELCVRRPGSGDAQWLLAAGGPLRNEDGESQGGVVFLRDITDLKRGEEALKRSNRELKETSAKLLSQSERLSLATTVAKVGVWEWDPASNLVTCDNTMYEIYGFSPVVAIPGEKWSAPTPYEKFAAAIHPEDLREVEATLQRAIAEKGQGSAEFRIVLADGSVRSISAVESVVLDARANVSSLIGVNIDITERKQAEEILEQSRKDQLRFKDEFLSHVSHELRSPLTAIKQFTTILLGGLAGELNKEQTEYQQIVLKNIRQLQSMIDDLLEVTRLETGKLGVEPESVSVSDAVTDIINSLRITAREKGITLSCDLPPDLPSAYADATRLRQILIILIDNAIKFTPSGGAVRIEARRLEIDPQLLLLEVSDTGCGIGPELAERIFERLYQVSDPNQASRKGLGLGLYICKELVTRHGGQIWVKSQPQKGSTFSFTLPVFSLNNLISPLLKNDKWPAESVALVMLEICMLDAWPSKESQEKWSREVRSLVQRCLLPNLDVLLPKMSYGAEGERFFVAAFADEKGASVLADRIREQCERLPDLKQTGLTLSVSYTMLKPFPPDVDASMENIVTSMATNLEESIKSQISSEAIYHE